MDNLTFAVTFAIVFFFHNMAYFRLVDNILAGRRHKSKFPTTLCSLLNGIIVGYVLYNLESVSSLGYIIVIVIFTAEIAICFKDHIVGMLVCILSLTLHIFCLRALVVGVFSLSTGMTFYELMQNDTYFWITLISTSALGMFAAVGCVLVIPKKYLNIINQHNDQMGFLLAIAALFNIYMVVNASIYVLEQDATSLVANEIIISIVMLLGLYISLFMLIRFDKLIGYNELLQSEIKSEMVYKQSLTTQSDIMVEFNCTQDRIITFKKEGMEKELEGYETYSQYVDALLHGAIHPEDAADVMKCIYPSNFVRAYIEGKRELALEYRCKDFFNLQGEYEWYKEHIFFDRRANGDVVALSTINNINESKLEELALKYRAERDALTGAYNKNKINEKANENLSEAGFGALIMLDLDNFKGINDNMGHAYGDKVLCEVYEKIKNIFRDRDIVGRIGGDEFVIFMSRVRDKAIIERKAQELCSAISSDYSSQNGVVVHISTSVGITIAPQDGIKYEDLIILADKAMYAAKRAGKDMYKFYDNATMSDDT